MKTLLIVDLQNDFLPGGALAVPEGDSIIPYINALMEAYDLVVATKDWHPLHHKSFAIEHGKRVGEVVKLEGMEQILWPVHCVAGSYGSEFPKSLKSEKIEKTFYKGVEERVDSYSAFYDNAHRRSTGLSEYLKERGVSEIEIVGLATDYCVKYSVLDALRDGFQVTVHLEGSKGIELFPKDIERALEEMRLAGAQFYPTT